MPQSPYSLIDWGITQGLDATDARLKAVGVESETQWEVPGLAHRLDESVRLTTDGPKTNVEPKALGETHAPTKPHRAHINPPTSPGAPSYQTGRRPQSACLQRGPTPAERACLRLGAGVARSRSF